MSPDMLNIPIYWCLKLVSLSLSRNLFSDVVCPSISWNLNKVGTRDRYRNKKTKQSYPGTSENNINFYTTLPIFIFLLYLTREKTAFGSLTLVPDDQTNGWTGGQTPRQPDRLTQKSGEYTRWQTDRLTLIII